MPRLSTASRHLFQATTPKRRTSWHEVADDGSRWNPATAKGSSAASFWLCIWCRGCRKVSSPPRRPPTAAVRKLPQLPQIPPGGYTRAGAEDPRGRQSRSPRPAASFPVSTSRGQKFGNKALHLARPAPPHTALAFGQPGIYILLGGI